jgi:hypothetical protein
MSEVVTRNHSQFPGIRFYPKDGLGSGVAMTECEYAVGVAASSQSIFQQLPPQFQDVKSGTFIISVRIFFDVSTLTYRRRSSGLGTST